MFVEERREEILKLLKNNSKVYVKELSKTFDVTEDCIRKDLAVMEANNLLKRTYGGAVAKDGLEHRHSSLVSNRKDENLEKKRAIAKKAVKKIKDGDMIFLDISTTNIELAKAIVASDKKVTVVSSMMDIAQVFTQTNNAKFILLGGEFNRSQNGFLGSLTIAMMENFRFDLCFMGAVGVEVQEGTVTTYVPEDGLMKTEAMKRGHSVYLVMEEEKFDFKANYVFATLSQVDGIICDKKPAKKIAKELEQYNLEII